MGPFIKSNISTKKIMLDILIALAPIIIFSAIKNGFIATLVFILTGTLSSLIIETLYSIIILKKKNIKNIIINDYSIFTGLFLSLIIPLKTPLLLLILATLLSSIFGKMIFGGFGKNKINPPLIGYILIYLLSYLNIINIDSSIIGNSHFSLILLAFAFLILTKTIKWRISLTYLLTIFAVNYVVGGVNNLGFSYPFRKIISSSMLFGSIFIITEQTTTPVTPIGQFLFGMYAGIITIIIRYITPLPQLELSSILIMNFFTKKIDKIGAIARFKFKESFIPFMLAWILILVLSIGVALSRTTEIKEIEEIPAIETKDETHNVSNELPPTKIISKNNIEDKIEYVVTNNPSETIKLQVIMKDGNITEINILEKNDEYFHILEEQNYINQIIEKQSTLNELGEITGAETTSNIVKNEIKTVLEDNKTVE